MQFDQLHNDEETTKFERLKDNFIWFYSNYEGFKKDFQNQYVAVKDKKQIDIDTNLDTLVKRLNWKNYGDSIAIECIDN
jgi:ssDNA-specific exonuclease RecJ